MQACLLSPPAGGESRCPGYEPAGFNAFYPRNKVTDVDGAMAARARGDVGDKRQGGSANLRTARDAAHAHVCVEAGLIGEWRRGRAHVGADRAPT